MQPKQKAPENDLLVVNSALLIDFGQDDFSIPNQIIQVTKG